MKGLNQILRFILIISLLAGNDLLLSAQQLRSAIPAHYYGPDQGLPSSELHSLLQDENGFLWIASDNGLIRFDGKNFKHYTSDDGLGNLVIFRLQKFGSDGILCATLDNRLYQVRGDSIQGIANNFIFQNQLRDDDLTNDVDVLADSSIILGANSSGPIEVSPTGELRDHKLPGGSGIYLKELKNGLNVSSWKSGRSNQALHVVLDLQSGRKDLVIQDRYLHTGPSRATIWDNRILLSNGNQLLCFKEDSLLFYKEFEHDINALVLNERYGLLIGCSEEGILRYHTFNDLELDNPETWIPGQSVSDILVMEDGEVFATTLSSGLAYIPSPYLKYITGAQNFTAITSSDNGIYIATKDKKLLAFDNGTQSTKELLLMDIYANSLYFNDSEGALLASAYGTLLVTGNEQNEVMCSDSLPIGPALKYSKGQGAKIWLAQRNGFACLDAKSGNCILHSNDQFFKHRVLCISETDDGNIWVGTADGLYYGKPNSLELTEKIGDIVLKGRVEDIIRLENGLLLFAVKGQGVVFHSSSENFTRLYDLTAGLISNIIEDLESNGTEELFIATTSGVQRLYLDGAEVLRSSYLNRDLGLLSNEVNQLSYQGSLLYSLGPGGISIIEKWPELDKGPRMLISEISTAEGDHAVSEKIILKYPHNSLKINFNGISFKESGKLIYRYRLQEDSTWYFTRNNSISVSDLSPGEYELLLQVGNGLVWGDEGLVHFSIQPAYWQSWWAKLIMYAFGGFLIYLFGRWAFRRLRKDDLLERRLGQLERSALLAQMNPHFVFNSLNSIQSYIAKNENDRAIRFLAKFSRLIRSTLNHSRAPRVNMQSELEALRLYLDLEQMRFKNKFDYEITVDDEIDPYDFMIPPLLIQPYLENAIIHGLSKKEGKGRIELFYLLQKDHLVVTVTDNGIGIEESKKQKEGQNSLHKSVGMTITQKRLELLDEKRNDKKVKIEEVKDKEGKILGTKVEVKIKLNEGEIT